MNLVPFFIPLLNPYMYLTLKSLEFIIFAEQTVLKTIKSINAWHHNFFYVMKCVYSSTFYTLGTNWGLLIYDWIVEKLRIKVAKEIKFHDFIAKNNKNANLYLLM